METRPRNITRWLVLLMIATVVATGQSERQSPAQLKEIADALGEATSASAHSKRAALKQSAQSLGMVEYRSAQYAEALAYFEVAVFIAKDGETEFIRGMTLLRLNRPEEAKPSFQSALLTASNRTVRESARNYLQKLEAATATGNVWASLDVGAGYNTNVGLESSTTATPASSPTTQTTLNAGWAWLYSPPISASVSYLAFWEEPFSEPTGRFLSQTLRAGAAYSPDAWTFRLTPAFQHQIYGSAAFLIRYFATVQVQRFFGPYAGGLQGELGQSVAQVSDYVYLNGTFHSIRLYAGYRTNEFNVQVAYALSKDAVGDRTEGVYLLPIHNASHGPSARVVWTPTPRWELTGSLSYLMRDFKTLALPGDLKRNDTQISSYVRVSRQISPGLSLYGSVQALINQSTLGDASGIEDKNYTQLVGLGGISWDIIN